MLRKFALIVIFFGVALFTPSYAHADCTASVSNINFGSVDVLPGSAVNATAAVDLNCNALLPGLLYRFCINIGSGADFSGSQRQLNGPGPATLNYDLYKDAARTQSWGSWQTGFQVAGLQIDRRANGSGNIVASVPIYARLFGNQQTAAAGSYSTSFPASAAGFYVRYGIWFFIPCNTGFNNTSASFAVLANVLSTCNVSATNVNFGTVGLLTSNVDATSAVRTQCSTSLPYTVSLNGGNAGASDPTQRKMSKASEQITYGLYRDAARVQPWGSTIGSDTVAGTGTGTAQPITVYGRVPAQATGSPGTYSDTIVVTVTY